MQSTMRATLLAAAGVTILAGCASAPPQPSAKDMTFFVTSVGPGKGGDLGGLAGADAHCQKLAAAAEPQPNPSHQTFGHKKAQKSGGRLKASRRL